MTSIFMVHSVLAVPTSGRVTRDSNRGSDSVTQNKDGTETSFSEILQQEVEEMRTDSISYRTVTYGMDRRLHHSEYRTREYHY